MNLRGHLENLSAPRNPNDHPDAHRQARDYITSELKSYSREVELEAFPFEGATGVNILSASRTDEPTFLVVAHYDTVKNSPGADDNGSAVAVALEIARQCPNVALLFPDLEERGLVGSRHFVKTGRWVGVPTLVLESVGYWSNEEHSQGHPTILPLAFPAHFEFLQQRRFRGDFWALLHLTHQNEQAESLKESMNSECLPFAVDPTLLQAEAGVQLRDFGRSDHLAFWEVGRDCLMLTDTANFRNPNYHQPSDRLETLDFEQMTTLCQDLIRFVGVDGLDPK